ncbi:MAG: homospermidine synthase, partial [Planctomycetaceae bacterium]
MNFDGRILIIGYGSVSRCALPLIFQLIKPDPANVTVIDFADLPPSTVKTITEFGVKFVQERIVRKTLGRQLAKYVSKGDMIIDLAWNIGCDDMLQWCHTHGVLYVNTSVEQWDPYEGAQSKPPTERTLYVRHQSMRKMISRWRNKEGTTAVVDHGANPGLVSHFTKQALEQIAELWLEDNKKKSHRRERISDALDSRAYNHLAQHLGVKVIHVSERDMQVANQPKRAGEFVNTWSIEGLYEEGTSPAEMGWGTHERYLPPRSQIHSSGPMNQICLANYGCRTWVRSWVPSGEIVGMVIRHGEAFSISEYLTVTEGGKPVYRPTVHYAYCPCDAAIASLHELHMRNFILQPRLRIMNDEITEGQDQLGCLLMGHDYKSWWIGSLLDIHESRKLVPHQNATTLQVACSVVAAAMWMIDNPHEGVCLPDQLPHEHILKIARPFLGPIF